MYSGNHATSICSWSVCATIFFHLAPFRFGNSACHFLLGTDVYFFLSLDKLWYLDIRVNRVIWTSCIEFERLERFLAILVRAESRTR